GRRPHPGPTPHVLPPPPTPSLPRAQRRQLHALGAPIHRNKTGTHIPMEGRVRPIHHTRHHAVLHRIDVHIRHVRSQVTLVADGVLPEPRLPRRLPVVRHTSGESLLDLAPESRVIAAALGHG